MSSPKLVTVLSPSSEHFSNDIYRQIIQKADLFPSSLVEFEFLTCSEKTTTNSLPTLNSATKSIIVTGESHRVMTETFLMNCQTVLGPSSTQAAFLGPKLLLSQGLPTALTNEILSALNMFDDIFLHSHTDLQNLQNVDTQGFLAKRAQYWPDLMYLLSVNQDQTQQTSTSSSIAIYLPRSITHRNPMYRRFLTSVVDAMVLVSQSITDCQFKVLVFDEDNDIHVAQDLACKYADSNGSENSTIQIQNMGNVAEQVLTNLQQSSIQTIVTFDYTLFQLSLLSGKSVICLTSDADEISKLATDVQLPATNIVNVTISQRYNMPEKIVPEDLANAIQTALQSSTANAIELSVAPQDYIDTIVDVLSNTTSTSGIIVGPIASDGTTSTPTNGVLHSLTSEQIISRVQQTLDATQQFVAAQSEYDPQSIALFICFQVTKRSEPSRYLHGLAKLLSGSEFASLLANKKLEQAIRWLIKDAFKNGLTYDYDSGIVAPSWLTHSSTSVFVQQPNFQISLDSQFMQSSYKGIHRSGWAYVVSGFAQLAQSDADVFLDTYSDSTWGWFEPVLAYEKIIPYTQPWIGVFHHGYQNTESFNVQTAIQKPTFQASLNQCRCLITLSEDLKTKLEAGLSDLQTTSSISFTIPPIIALVHPTESVPRESQFTIDAFTANQEPKIIQVGSFYRNSYAIYALPLGGGSDNDDYANALALQKCHLRAVDSARYFRPTDLFDKMATIDVVSTSDTSNDDNGSISRSISRSISGYAPTSISNGSISRSISGNTSSNSSTTTNNVYIQGLIQVAQQMDASVTVLEHVNHADYDVLLAENIVFINLIDCSGCNLLIECIVRNTPILINPLPAVVELLGEYYPFYYSSLTEAASKANSISLIQATTSYLENMDKSKLQLDVFLNDFQTKLAPYMTSTSKVSVIKRSRQHNQGASHKSKRSKK